MGTKCAILFMDRLERDFLSTRHLVPLVWWRYIDDIFMVWQRSAEELYSFLDALNAFHETIKFMADISKTSVNFLDVKISQDEHSIITTDLYTKPTDSHLYLYYSSFHPRHQKQSLPYNQALRIRQICNTDLQFEKASQTMTDNFIIRGYPSRLVKSAIHKKRRPPAATERNYPKQTNYTLHHHP